MQKILEEEAKEERDCAEPKVRGVETTWRTENYKVAPQVRDSLLGELGLEAGDIEVDLFATEANRQCDLYCCPERDAFAYDWTTLGERAQGDGWLWANPPFSMLLLVLGKILESKCRIVVVVPKWPWLKWFGGLQVLAQEQALVPENEGLYLKE